MSAERERVAGFGRLEDGLLQAGEWYRWGPYVSERQWGTVREDYSADGNAWDYLPHDHARSRAYRWGEDGLAARLYGAAPVTPYPKDGINDHVVSGAGTINPDRTGTKCAFWYGLTVLPGQTAELRLRLRPAPSGQAGSRGPAPRPAHQPPSAPASIS